MFFFFTGNYHMKKIAFMLVIGCLNFTGSTWALAEDIPATLNITGTVNNANGGCTVSLRRPGIMDLGTHKLTDLPNEGHYSESISGYTNVVTLSGDNCTNKSGTTIALKFIGDADSNGASFTNSSVGSDAATGIGVAVYGPGGYTLTPNFSEVPAFDSQYVFSVGMVKLNDSAPTPGSVTSSITIEVDRI
jgi:type 1 fimbrial protein